MEEVVSAVGGFILEFVGDAIEQAVGDSLQLGPRIEAALAPLDISLDRYLPAISLPEITLPSFALPDLSLPAWLAPVRDDKAILAQLAADKQRQRKPKT